jgi:hypothetical protein
MGELTRQALEAMLAEARSLMRDFGQVMEPTALRLEHHYKELVRALRDDARGTLNLEQAGRFTGWSKSKLRRDWRMIPVGMRIGRSGNPCFSVDQLQPKPGHVPPVLDDLFRTPAGSMKRKSVATHDRRVVRNLRRAGLA